MQKEVDNIRILTNEDKVRIYFKKKRGKIIKFIIQYFSLIDGRWRSVIRIDTCHDYVHIHTYHLNTRENNVKLSKDSSSNNQLFTESKEYVIKEYQRIKENYLFTK